MHLLHFTDILNFSKYPDTVAVSQELFLLIASRQISLTIKL